MRRGNGSQFELRPGQRTAECQPGFLVRRHGLPLFVDRLEPFRPNASQTTRRIVESNWSCQGGGVGSSFHPSPRPVAPPTIPVKREHWSVALVYLVCPVCLV